MGIVDCVGRLWSAGGCHDAAISSFLSPQHCHYLPLQNYKIKMKSIQTLTAIFNICLRRRPKHWKCGGTPTTFVALSLPRFSSSWARARLAFGLFFNRKMKSQNHISLCYSHPNSDRISYGVLWNLISSRNFVENSIGKFKIPTGSITRRKIRRSRKLPLEPDAISVGCFYRSIFHRFFHRYTCVFL